MARLASPISELRNHYTVVIVGSGYGGGITASRLARAGQQVCVLERGKEFQPGEYPNTQDAAFDEVQMDLWFNPTIRGSRKGLFDLRFNPDMNVFVGCGLGGTSLVNANVCMEAEDAVFDQSEWPVEIKSPEGRAEIAKGYKYAKEMLRPVEYDFKNDPKKFPPLKKLSAVEESAAHLKEQFKPTTINVNFEEFPNNTNHVGVEQHRCVGCGDCMTGCNYRAKNTVLMNYLPDAKNHGAEIFTEISVRRVEKHENRWAVHYQHLQTGNEGTDLPTMMITADIVVLAAGALGSTEILLRSRGSLPMSNRLGQNFTGNGDVLAFGYNCDQKINGVGFGALSPKGRDPVGPCITGIIDARRKPDLRDSLVIEDGSVAGAFARLLPQVFALTGLSGRDTDLGFLDKIREKWRKWLSLRFGPYHGAVQNTQTFLVMGHDDGQGRMSLKNDRLRIDWEGAGNQPNIILANQKLKEATAALGGSYLKNPVTNRITGNDLMTVHPLGGCVMADGAEKGVVNHKGQVFSGSVGKDVYESLYVSDGSVIPRSLGINPLLTISALAERCCCWMAKDRGWKIDYSMSLLSAGGIKQQRVKAIGQTQGERMMETATKPGVSFRETMKGGFALGETDPKAGEKKGDTEGTPLAIHCEIDIPDVYGFIGDPQHYAAMRGRVDFAPLGMNIPAPSGRFNLFSPSDNPRLKHMVYELSFEHGGQQYYVAGKKDVRDDPGMDMWADITTCYTRLHSGQDQSGAVLGAGVIYIKREQLLNLIPTIHATNTNSKQESLKVLADFGKFFMGSIWDTFSR